MKRVTVVFMVSALSTCVAAVGDGFVLTPGTAEVVVSATAAKQDPAAQFAAEEMTNFLSRVFGAPVKLVCAPTPGKTSIVIGSNEWSRAAGIDVAMLPRDAYAVKVTGDRVFVAGRDSPEFSAFEKEWGEERGTVHGVYGFLERFAGCRFYFPGELGEIVPRTAKLAVPCVDYIDAPDYMKREIPHELEPWYEPVSSAEYRRIDRLTRYRLKVETKRITACHGQYFSKLAIRFGASHPEYFCLMKDGSRCTQDTERPPYWRNAQTCQSSAVWDEIYRDARSYFLGEGSEVRGMIAGKAPHHRVDWPWIATYRSYYDVMPPDGMGKCLCPSCQAAYAKAKNPVQYATELVWGQTARAANRLIREGIPGHLVMAAYSPYRDVPDFDIPTNVVVFLCSNGSWTTPAGLRNDLEVARAWTGKLHGKVIGWNNTGKHSCFKLNIDDVPSVTPHAFGRYYKAIAPLMHGAYCSNRSDKYLFSALNYYVYAKVSWDNSVDVEALLDEYYRLMFGAAAQPMRKFFDAVEDKWMNEILGNAVETPVGSVPASPPYYAVWTRIYSHDAVGELARHFDAAAAAVKPGSLEARRVALFRREFLEPMIVRADMYLPDAVAKENQRRQSVPESAVVGEFADVTIDVEGDKTRQEVHSKVYPLKLEAGKAYRVSYFLKCTDAKPYPCATKPNYDDFRVRLSGGVQGVVQTTTENRSAVGAIGSGEQGTFGPVLQTFVAKMPESLPPDAAPRLILRSYRTAGRAEFSGIRVEEVR